MSIRATHSYADRSDLAGDLAWVIANQLLAAAEETGQARIAVSGGITPKLLFGVLGDIDLPWEAINITFVDDRCVPTDHDQSNVALVQEFLMNGMAANANLYPLFNAELGQSASAAAATEQFAPADILLLGMGEDAHTASLFPGSQQLAAGLDDLEPAIIATDATAPPLLPRLTMNKSAIDAAGLRILHIEGQAKREVFEAAKQPNTDPMLSPISAFLNDPHADIEVYWAP